MIPFVNIHTHHLGNNDEEIVLKNIITLKDNQTHIIGNYSVGIHPWYINEEHVEEQFMALQSLAFSPACLALGECGLDKLRGPNINLQQVVFIRQINLAIKTNKPLVVHCVHAFDKLLSIIKKYNNKAIFLVHGFNGNIQIAEQLLKQGVYLSFGKALLNGKNEKLKIIFKQMPLDKVFLENDDSTTPIYRIYEAAAQIKNCNLNVMKEVIFVNYKKVFLHE